MEISELYEIFKQHPVVTTDSRDCPVGSLFFALKGTSFNGNKFAAAALEKGCAYAVVDEAEYVVEGDARFILVDNCLHTLQQLARYHRRALGTPIIGITGTNGKTTTKELTAAVLLQKYNVLYTEGNFNNDIGVPKTLLRLNSTHDIAVVEMGASHPGDIKTLVEIVEPDYALITNVGRAHLQGFGSFEGVIKTKGELYDFVRAAANGENDAYAIREVKRPRCVFIDNDNQYLNGIADGLNLVRYGLNAADKKLYVAASDVKSEPMLSFSWAAEGKAQHHVDSHLIGAYNITNMLAAIAVGTYFGVEADKIDAALTGYAPSNNRSQFEQTACNRLIVDAYNANPTSMAAALDSFGQIATQLPKMAILGDMRELGEVSEAEHQKVVDTLKAKGLNDVWLVGEEFGKTRCDFHKYNNVEEVKQAIASYKPCGKCILIKGSNGTKLFELPELL